MRLWVRLAAVLALVAVVPVLVIGSFAIYVSGQRALEDSQTALYREAVDQAEFVDRWVADHAEALLVKPGLFTVDFTSETSLQGFLRVVYLDVPSAVTVVMVDGDGLSVAEPVFQSAPTDRRVASSGERAQQLIDRLPLSSALALPDVVHLGAAWLPDGPSGRPSIPLAVVVTPADSTEEQRILGVEVTLELAEELMAGVSADHAITLLDSTGTPLLGAGQPLVDGEFLKLMRPLLGQDADFRLEGEQGAVVGTIVHVSVPQWSIVVAEPERVALGSAHEIRGTLVVIVAGAVLIAIVLAFALAGEVSEPIERLRDAALALAEGGAGHQADVHRGDEIGELARAFNHMSGRLAANQAEIAAQQREIHAFNAELQERVELRTQELREAQDQLVRSGQLAAVAEVGAGLAHELNNPLAAILGWIQVLRVRHEGSQEEQMLRDVEAEASRCREVVAAMLRFASGEVDPLTTPVVVVQDVLSDVVELVRGQFRQRGVELELDEAGTALRVRVDPVQGARIVAQVLGAVRAGLPAGSRVTLGAALHDRDVRVQIRSDQPIAGETSRQDDWKASGHGLWVARQMLDRVGGRLEHDDDQTWLVILPEA